MLRWDHTLQRGGYKVEKTNNLPKFLTWEPSQATLDKGGVARFCGFSAFFLACVNTNVRVFLHGYGRYVCREAQVTLDEFEESDERIRASTLTSECTSFVVERVPPQGALTQ